MASKKILTHKPITETKVTSFFGKRSVALWNATRNHKGLDLGGSGTSLYAAAAGKIKTKGYNSERGYYVEIEIKKGTTIFYQHMKTECKIKTGTAVKSGKVIGKKGSTGASTAPHLHFEVRLKGKPVDPLPYFIASFKSTKIKHTLRYKASNTTVQWILENKKLQEMLKSQKMYTGSIDGLFGPQTKKAVGKFQKKYGLAVDYIFGPKCLAMAKKKGLL